MITVSAAYTENYFSEQYHKHDFSASMSETHPDGSDAVSIHARLMQVCKQMVASEIAKCREQAEARNKALTESAQTF
jgi:hypothetical protein